MSVTKESQHLHEERAPVLEDVLPELAGKSVFSVLDLKDAYWQIKLDDESSYLCTFNTPFGRFRFLKMPFGISSAAEVLQRKTHQVFGDISGVHIIADDMLIAAENKAEHDQIMRRVLERGIQKNIKFNFSKLKLKRPSVEYNGVIISAQGQRPDPKKVNAIAEMPDPTDKEGVRRLIGMVNYLTPFIPNKAEVIAPLRALLRNDVPFHWEHEQVAAVDRIRTILTSDPVLQIFDPKKPTTIQADASSTGLGACLMQDSRPVAYASRSLTDTESRYAQIEKELLAIVFAVTKFHFYIYGREVLIESDHKPLESIVKKPLHTATPRIQLMLLRLMRYHFQLKYIPGSHMYIADTLSRAHIGGEPDDSMDIGQGEYRIHSVTAQLPATEECKSQLREATERDEALSKLRQFTSNGWPAKKSSVPLDLQPYWTVQYEIHEQDSLMYVGERLIVPSELPGEMLLRLHEGHAGMEKCKLRAQEVIYWPNISKDIETHIGKCPVCATYSKSNPAEPMIPHDIPSRPWSKLGADVLEYGGRSYLVVVDYYSKYPEVHQLTNKTASGIVSVLKPMFARHGIPDKFVSDNMPFSRTAFHNFAATWGFSLVTSSPLYPKLNGQSERFVQTVKNMMRKTMKEGKEPHLALLEYRNTPLSGISYSPAQLLMPEGHVTYHIQPFGT